MIDEGPIMRRIDRLQEWVERKVFAVAQSVFVAKSSADGLSDFAKGETQADGTTSDLQMRRYGSGGWGLAGVPPAGEPGMIVNSGGGGTNSVLVAVGGPRYMPSGLADGDTCLFNKTSGVKVYLKASDGSVTITDTAGNKVVIDGSATITVNAATIKLGSAAVDSLVKGTTYRTAQTIYDTAWSTFVSSVNTWATAVKTYANAIQPVADPANGTDHFTDTIKTACDTMVTACTTMNTATTTFEAGSAGYLSTISKTA